MWAKKSLSFWSEGVLLKHNSDKLCATVYGQKNLYFWSEGVLLKHIEVKLCDEFCQKVTIELAFQKFLVNTSELNLSFYIPFFAGGIICNALVLLS